MSKFLKDFGWYDVYSGKKAMFVLSMITLVLAMILFALVISMPR
jgi:hypothetical protein